MLILFEKFFFDVRVDWNWLFFVFVQVSGVIIKWIKFVFFGVQFDTLNTYCVSGQIIIFIGYRKLQGHPIFNLKFLNFEEGTLSRWFFLALILYIDWGRITPLRRSFFLVMIHDINFSLYSLFLCLFLTIVSIHNVFCSQLYIFWTDYLMLIFKNANHLTNL